jgi:hypothetical protein
MSLTLGRSITGRGVLAYRPSDLFPAIVTCRSHTRKVRAGFRKEIATAQ